MIKVCIGSDRDWNDAQDEFSDMQYWANKNCKSFVAMTLHDVSDVSIYYDLVAEFSFRDDKDAMLFKLKWMS
jgi:hypothetical protein